MKKHGTQICAYNPERQWNPGLQQKEYCQKTEGGDSHLLLYSCEIPPVELRTVLVSPDYEGRATVRSSLEEGHQLDKRIGEPHLQSQDEKVEAVQPEEQIMWKSHSNIPVSFPIVKLESDSLSGTVAMA